MWDICVYMLDGERPCSRGESVQKTHTIVYDRTRHVVVARTADSILLSAYHCFLKIKKSYFTNLSVFKFNSTFTFLPNTYVNPCTLVRPI